MKFAASVRKSDAVVVGLWRGGGNVIPGPPAEDPTRSVELTEAEHDEINQKGLSYHHGGPARWKENAGVFTEQSDSRPTARFTPTSVSYPVDDQAAAVIVTVAKLVGGNGSAVDTGFQSNVRITVKVNAVERRLRLDFTDGEATINIKRNRPIEATLEDNEQYLVEEPLTVDIYSDALEGN